MPTGAALFVHGLAEAGATVVVHGRRPRESRAGGRDRDRRRGGLSTPDNLVNGAGIQRRNPSRSSRSRATHPFSSKALLAFAAPTDGGASR